LFAGAGAGIFAGEVAFGRHSLDWSLGIAMGALCAVYLAVRESPPPHIENWRSGAHGERRTARELASLARSGWYLVHDRRADHGNFDHVIVGRPGSSFWTANVRPAGLSLTDPASGCSTSTSLETLGSPVATDLTHAGKLQS
jgi:hypothetical protein